MGKAPAFQFYPGDWIQDTRILTPQTRGIWIDLLCFMWRSETRGKLSMTIPQLARLVSCSDEEILSSLRELRDTKCADVTFLPVDNPNRNAESNGGCNAHVTVINRRMMREENERNATRSRVKRHRNANVKRGCNGEGNGGCNEEVTPPSSSSSSSSYKSNTDYITGGDDHSPLPDTPPEALEDQKPGIENRTIHPEIKPLCEKIMITFPRFNVLTFLGNHTRDNQDAVVHCLRSLLKHHREIEPIKNPMQYLEATMAKENQNYNARDHDARAQEFKKPIKPGEMNTLGNVLRGMSNPP